MRADAGTAAGRGTAADAGRAAGTGTAADAGTAAGTGTAADAGVADGSPRRGDLDRIRLALVAVSFLSACVLQAVGPVLAAADRWLAPAFFAVSGCAASLARRRDSASERVIAGVLRLFVPTVVGVLLFAVPLFYLKRPGEVDEWAAHLWFLPALFAFSLVMLPILARLRTPRGRAFSDRLGRPAAATIALLLPVALAAALAALPRVGTWAGSAGACAAGFALGAAIATGPALEAAVNRRRWVSLVVTAALLVGLAAAWSRDEAPALAARLPLEAAAAGSLIPIVLGFGLRRASASRQVPGRLSEYLLPFFVLSRPAFLAVSRAMAGLPIGTTSRTAIATLCAAVLTIAAGELVRRYGLLRFLFGLRERSNAS